MKVAHVKTVDGTTVMINLKTEFEQKDFLEFIKAHGNGGTVYDWEENGEICFLYNRHVISVRIREVNE